MWTISFLHGGARIDIAITGDKEKGRRVFDLFKAIHEEAVAVWQKWRDDNSEVIEEKLRTFAAKSPVHSIASRYIHARLLLLPERDYPPEIEETPLAALLHEDES